MRDVCAAAAWLIRRDVRRLARTSAGVAELRDLMRTRLHAASLPEVQALLASLVDSRATGMRLPEEPQVMLRLPAV